MCIRDRRSRAHRLRFSGVRVPVFSDRRSRRLLFQWLSLIHIYQQRGNVENIVRPVAPAGNEPVKVAEELFGPQVDAAFLPVSYTHLDVYKRQLSCRAWFR